jgi:hypothetical protein
MKVKELIATLLTLPPDANVYTEQYSTNAVAQVAVNRDENYVLIGDDLDSLIEGAPTHMNCPVRIPTVAIPSIYVVHFESADEGVPCSNIECYSDYTAARACFKKWVAEEKSLREDQLENAIHISVTESATSFRWENAITGDYSEIWIQERFIWGNTPDTKEEETKGE